MSDGNVDEFFFVNYHWVRSWAFKGSGCWLPADDIDWLFDELEFGAEIVVRVENGSIERAAFWRGAVPLGSQSVAGATSLESPSRQNETQGFAKLALTKDPKSPVS